MSESLVKSLGYNKRENMNELVYVLDFTEVKQRDDFLRMKLVGSPSTASKAKGITSNPIHKKKRGTPKSHRK